MRESWRLNKDCNILTPQLFWLSQPFLFSWAAQPGAWGPSLCWDMVLIPASSLQLIWTSCHRGYIIIWYPPTSCECHNFTLNSTPRQSRLPLISWYLRPDAPVIYTGAFLILTAWPSRRSICNNRSQILSLDIFVCFFILLTTQYGSELTALAKIICSTWNCLLLK